MLEELEVLLDLLVHKGFLVGIAAGLIGGTLLFAAARTLKGPVVGWGIAFVIGVVAATAAQFDIGTPFLVRIALVGAGGLLIDVADRIAQGRWKVIFRAVAWGTVVLAVISFSYNADPIKFWWTTAGLAIVTLALGAALWMSRGQATTHLVGPLMIVSVLGVWVTVPETDTMSIILGVVLTLGWATLPPVRAGALATGAFPLAAVFAQFSLVGGAGRLWTYIAAWACVGVLVLVPFIGLARKSLPSGRMILGTHIVYVFAVTRAADLTESVYVMSVVALVLFLLAAVVLLLGSKAAAKPVSTES